jgi:hypothetical protein
MADLTISGVGEITTTSGSVLATTTAQGIAGASITPGQVLYADPTNNNFLLPAKASDVLQVSHIVGIALNTAAANQPVTYATAGDITLSNANGVTSGTVYVVSNTTGGGFIAPVTDAPPNVAVLGVGNGGTTSGGTNNFRIGLIPTAVAH